MLFVCLITSCNTGHQKFPEEVRLSSSAYNIDQNSPKSIWTVAGTPVGNIPRYTYLPQNHTLILDTSLMADWDFLPLPANQSFVIDALGVDKLPLEIVVISEPLEIGKTYQIQPLAMMELTNRHDHKEIIVGIPVDPELRIIETSSFVDFLLDYDPIKNLLQNYYMNHKGVDTYSQINWHNEQFAYSAITQCVDLFLQQ